MSRHSRRVERARAERARLEGRSPIYPLRYVRPYPGPRPPVWRVLAMRRWKRAIEERNAAKRWNFGAVYGRRTRDLPAPTPGTTSRHGGSL